MLKRISLLAILLCIAPHSVAQFRDSWFECYGMASAMKTVDATAPGTVVVVNPPPNQQLDSGPRGLASGVRTGLEWRYDRVALVAEIGYHRYSDHTGSTSLAPLMAGFRIYSEERFRTSFFGEGLAGAYRWRVNSGTTNFTASKGIVAAGGGMDIRLSRHWVWRVVEFQLAIAGARNGPLLSGGPSTGIAYRFGERE